MFSPDFEGQIICLSQQIISESFSESDILDQIFQITLNPVIRIDQDCQKIFRLYYDLMLLKIRQTEFIKHRKEILKSIIRAMMYELMETMTESDELSSIKQKDIIFKKFMNLLVSQTVKPRYISWYSDQLNITPKYLSTICKNVSGKTAFELINQYITADIRHLLKDTNRSIKEITHMLDFPNISFFGKYVKAHTGYSPTTYRIVLRNAE
jgi:YesN/AraC family two-component response regulator